jgi:hypothetical protein
MIKALSAKWDGWQNRVTGLIDNRVVSVSLIFVIFFGAGTTLTYRSLSYPWHWDDLHLVRTFSTAELASVFRGNWDVDDIENSGYRPLTVVFNHLRAAAFGECVVAHRLFDVALVAAYLALLASLAMRLRLSYGGAVLGGILAISAKNNWWNLVWICDGIHAFMELLVLLAAYFTLSAVRKFAIWKIVLATLFAGLGLLVREDAVAMFPVIPMFALVYAAQKKFPFVPNNRTASIWRELRDLPWLLISSVSAVLAAMALLSFHVRSLLVPSTEMDVNLQAWSYHMAWALYPMGVPADGTILHAVWVLWLAALVLLACSIAFPAPGSSRLVTLFWVGAAVITTTPIALAPGVVEPRPNLLLAPISFFSFGVAFLLSRLVAISRRALIPAACVMSVVVIASIARNEIAQEAAHPKSLEYILNNAYFVWPDSAPARIPEARLTGAKQEFLELGINSKAQFHLRFPELVQQAENLHLSRPNREGKPFIPRIQFMQP